MRLCAFVVLLLAMVSEVAAAPCAKVCAPAIAACRASRAAIFYPPAFCRRLLMAQCRPTAPHVCTYPLTVTSTTSTTTTTIPGALCTAGTACVLDGIWRYTAALRTAEGCTSAPATLSGGFSFHAQGNLAGALWPLALDPPHTIGLATMGAFTTPLAVSVASVHVVDARGCTAWFAADLAFDAATPGQAGTASFAIAEQCAGGPVCTAVYDGGIAR